MLVILNWHTLLLFLGSQVLVTPDFRPEFRNFVVTLLIRLGLTQMIDTIKLAIPLTKRQHALIHNSVVSDDQEQWALFNPFSGELRMIRIKGLAQTDQHSFHREIRFDVSPIFVENDTYLWIELSLPKLWYGHNIWLLYGFTKALSLLKERLEIELNLTRKNKLPDILTWQVRRLDICYAWKFPSQFTAESYLDSLKHLHFPRKQPVYYSSGLAFIGGTYSLKFYLKLPEFRKHDLPELVKRKYRLEYINDLESRANGILRCEATIRNKYLKREMKVDTVSDLLKESIFYVFHGEWPEDESTRMALVVFVLFNRYPEVFNLNEDETINYFLDCVTDKIILSFSVDNQNVDEILASSEIQEYISRVENKFTDIKEKTSLSYQDWLRKLISGEISLQVKKESNLVSKLQYFLTKFIGENSTMQEAHWVEQKLNELYKANKVARLMGFWLYVQRFGSNKAKDIYGRNPYYEARADLKAAGVSLIEPHSKVIYAEEEFLRTFRMEVPSSHVVNRWDNERDSENLLNFCDHKGHSKIH